MLLDIGWSIVYDISSIKCESKDLLDNVFYLDIRPISASSSTQISFILNNALYKKINIMNI